MADESINRTKNNRRWKKIEKLAGKIAKSGETIVVLRYNNSSQAIEFTGSSHMMPFVRNVESSFLNAATQRRQEIKFPPGLAHVTPTEINQHNLRKIVADVVGQYVYQKYNIRRGFWGIQNLAPEWYPKDVGFYSPNDNKQKRKRLTREDCEKIVQCYKCHTLKELYRSKETASSHQLDADFPDGEAQETVASEQIMDDEYADHQDVELPESAVDGTEPHNEYADHQDAEVPESVLDGVEPLNEYADHQDGEVRESVVDGAEPHNEYADHQEPESMVDGPEPHTEDADHKDSEMPESAVDGDEPHTELSPLTAIESILSEGNDTKFPSSTDKRRYHAGREVIDRQDLMTLKDPNWVNDKIINAYLAVLQSETNRKNNEAIFCLPSYIFSMWEAGIIEAWMLKKVQFCNMKWAFLPVNINRNHWMLLAANIQTATVHLLDSMNGHHPKVVDMWRMFTVARERHYPGDLPTQWRDGCLTSAKQTDGSACGAFVMLNALALTTSIPLNLLNHGHAISMRKFVLAKLMENRFVPGRQKTVCDALTCTRPGIKQTWINCDVCGRWLHVICANVADPSAIKEFICVVCVAAYS